MLFGGDLKKLSEHEHRYKDRVVNRPRKYKDSTANYVGDNINGSIRTFLTQHRSEADKGIFDDLRPTESYSR